MKAPTARELQVFAAVCRWGCDKDAARALDISQHTVRGHVAKLYVKLGATSRLEAAMLLGWLLLPPAAHPNGLLLPTRTVQTAG